MTLWSGGSDDDEDESGGLAPWFATPQLEQRLDLIQHLLEYSNQLILVLGQAAAGRSTFCDELSRRARPAWRVVRIDGHAGLTPGDCLAELASAFGISRRGDTEGLRLELEAQFAAYERADLTPIAIVDDAGSLPDATLALLLALAQPPGQEPRMHAVLAGTPDLTTRLGNPAAGACRQEITHSLELPPFDLGQTGDFLASQFAGEAEFSPEAVTRIHRQSQGLPGRIRELAIQATAAAVEAAEVPGAPPRPRLWPKTQHLVAGALVLVFSAAIAWLALKPGTAPPPPVAINIKLPPRNGAPELPAPGGEPATTDPSAPAPVRDAVPANAPLEPDEVFAPVDLPGSEPSPVPPEPGAATAAPAVSPPPPPPAPVPERPEPRPVAAPVATPAPGPAPGSKPAAAAALSAPLPGGVHGPEWLRAQSGERYFLQLFGTHDEAGLRQFIARHRLGASTAWFRTTHNGRPWYVVVHGPYTSRTAAAAGAAKLAPALRALKPWPRSVKSIRDAMS